MKLIHLLLSFSGSGIINVRQNQAGSASEAIGIIQHSGPAQQKYSTVEARLRSFRDWPPGLKQRPSEIAEAGFYYIGKGDQVKCFYCDGGLQNWQHDDDPWVEHSRWFDKCGFVRLVKGDEFIAKCLAEKPPVELLEESNPVFSNQLPSQLSSAESHQSLNTASATANSLSASTQDEQLKSTSAPGSVIGAIEDSKAKANIVNPDNDLGKLSEARCAKTKMIIVNFPFQTWNQKTEG